MQEKDSILICDLTHTGSKSYSPNLIPYPIGCIKSYCLEYSKFAAEFEIDIFKDPQEFIDAAIKKKSSIIGFGNYVWNLELSTDIAKEIKSMNPETLIVFGGPNFPLEDTKRIEWLKERPFVDIYVTGDGEETFTKIVDSWYQCKNIEQVKKETKSRCSLTYM